MLIDLYYCTKVTFSIIALFSLGSVDVEERLTNHHPSPPILGAIPEGSNEHEDLFDAVSDGDYEDPFEAETREEAEVISTKETLQPPPDRFNFLGDSSSTFVSKHIPGSGGFASSSSAFAVKPPGGINSGLEKQPVDDEIPEELSVELDPFELESVEALSGDIDGSISSPRLQVLEQPKSITEASAPSQQVDEFDNFDELSEPAAVTKPPNSSNSKSAAKADVDEISDHFDDNSSIDMSDSGDEASAAPAKKTAPALIGNVNIVSSKALDALSSLPAPVSRAGSLGGLASLSNTTSLNALSPPKALDLGLASIPKSAGLASLAPIGGLKPASQLAPVSIKGPNLPGLNNLT